jgi:hypothetical protein
VAVRLELHLSSQSEWIKLFDPRDWTIFVPSEEAVEIGSNLRIDLDVGGWLVTLRGTVLARRDDPTGLVVALGGSEREKINYLNGFVRGGLLNLRGKRRLPIKLSVTYGAIEGPANTFTKDINEEGLFLFTDRPLPETSQVHVDHGARQGAAAVAGRQGEPHDRRDGRRAARHGIVRARRTQRESLTAVIEELEEQLKQRTAADDHARVTACTSMVW